MSKNQRCGECGCDPTLSFTQVVIGDDTWRICSACVRDIVAEHVAASYYHNPDLAKEYTP